MREERIGGQRLILGDCLEVLPTLGRFDVVVTDPPYGLAGANTEKNLYNSFSDNASEVLRIVGEIMDWGNYDRMVMTPGQSLMFRHREPSAVGVFYYPAGTGSCSWGFVGWQPIFYYGKDPVLADGKGRSANSFYATDASEKNGHPCPKPIGQWSRLVKRASREGETVLDPFMGSGTTLVACQRLGRSGTGIEIDPDYFDIACRRVEEASRQPDLFVAPPAPAKQESFL